MRSTRLILSVFPSIMLALIATPFAAGSPFSMSYRPYDYPENEGWTRWLYDPNGDAVRSLGPDGLTLDSRTSLETADFYYFNSNAMILALGESLTVSWREQTIFSTESGEIGDQAIVLKSPMHTFCELDLHTDSVMADFDHDGTPDGIYGLEPGAIHEYTLMTSNYIDYALSIDGQFAFNGLFAPWAGSGPGIAWGDEVIGGSSLAVWSGVDIVVTPEPPAAMGIVSVLCAMRGIRCRITSGQAF